MKKHFLILLTLAIGFSFLLGGSLEAKKKKHPYDVYDHEMHMGFFDGTFQVTCDTCHADPESFANRKKVNPKGCHTCHKNLKAPIAATPTCTICHLKGPPKPENHKTNWNRKHQIYAKQNRQECNQCHTNKRFCLDCHQKRDTIRQRGHKRNFRFFHSIEARANPRRCDVCHTVNYCQECHSGRGSSKR